MISPKKRIHPQGAAGGFSLIELFVASSVAILLLVMLSTIVSSSVISSQQISGKLEVPANARVALDYLERDLYALLPPDRSQTTISLLGESIQGTATTTPVKSCWIMLVTRPMTGTDSGAFRTVSYRMVYTDPMVAGGMKPRLAIYRTVLDPVVGAPTTFVGASDLHAGFWGARWTAYEAQNGGADLLDDFLVEDILDFEVRINYRDAMGALVTKSVGDGDLYHLTREGFVDATVAPPTPLEPISLTLVVTSLRKEGATLYEAGAIGLPDAMEKYGECITRTFRLDSVTR